MWQARLKDYEAMLSKSPKDPVALEVSHWLFCGISVLFFCYYMLILEIYLWSFDLVLTSKLVYGYVKHIFGSIHICDMLWI